MGETAKHVSLSAETLLHFDTYIRDAETAMELDLPTRAPFLRTDLDPKRADQIRTGAILAQSWMGEGPKHVPDGLIHDWTAAAFAPGVTLQELLAVIQDYDNYKNVYRPEVIDSRLLSRNGNDFQIFLRFLKKKVITVVLDTDHDAHYVELSPTRWTCRSSTTRICDVEHAGKPNETVMPPDHGFGFMWRLNSYWCFEERDGGVWLECRAISLSRDIPTGLAWIIEPIVRKLPRESLIHTLQCTRQALVREKISPEATV